MYGQWKRTFDRGYQCRFVYYSLKVLGFFSLLSFAYIGGEIIYSISINKQFSILNFPWKVIFFGVVLISYIFLLKHNSVYNNQLKGVWQKYAEINKLHINWIDDNSKLLYSELNNKKK